MKRSDLIRYLEAAEELLEIHGRQKSDKPGIGLWPFFAVGLTCLPQDVIDVIAPQLASKDSRAWSTVEVDNKEEYKRRWEEHYGAVQRELGLTFGPSDHTLANKEGFLRKTIDELRELG